MSNADPRFRPPLDLIYAYGRGLCVTTLVQKGALRSGLGRQSDYGRRWQWLT